MTMTSRDPFLSGATCDVCFGSFCHGFCQCGCQVDTLPAEEFVRNVSLDGQAHLTRLMAGGEVLSSGTGVLGPPMCERCGLVEYDDLHYYVCCSCCRGLCYHCAVGCDTCLSIYCRGHCRCVCHLDQAIYVGSSGRLGPRQSSAGMSGTSHAVFPGNAVG